MTGSIPSARAASGPQVRLVRDPTGIRPSAYTGARTGTRRPGVNPKTRRISAWIVRSIIVLTTAFALFDLYLLATTGHS